MRDALAAPDTGALAMAARVAAGHLGEPEQRWLQHGFRTWLDARGTVSADACLRLPTSPAQVRLALRDEALVAAAWEVTAAGPWACAQAVAEELNRYCTRGGWRTWRELPEPPPGCSQLRIELHKALRFNDGETLSGTQIYRIVRHIWAEKCRVDSSTLTSSNHMSEP